MELTAGIIAGHLQGEVVGDPNVVITGVARIEQSKPEWPVFLPILNMRNSCMRQKHQSYW